MIFQRRSLTLKKLIFKRVVKKSCKNEPITFQCSYIRLNFSTELKMTEAVIYKCNYQLCCKQGLFIGL